MECPARRHRRSPYRPRSSFAAVQRATQRGTLQQNKSVFVFEITYTRQPPPSSNHQSIGAPSGRISGGSCLRRRAAKAVAGAASFFFSHDNILGRLAESITNKLRFGDLPNQKRPKAPIRISSSWSCVKT